MGVAVNNETGEVLIQQGDTWVKPQVAKNEAGERVYFDGSTWQAFPKPNPTASGVLGRYKNIGQGFVQGLRDIEGGSVQLMGKILEAAAPSESTGSNARSFIRSENEKNDATRRGFEQDYAKERGPVSGVDVPRLAGQAIAGLPVAAAMPATIPGAIGAGVATNAMLPVSNSDDFLKEKLVQAGAGAAGGLVGGLGAKMLGKAMTGATDPNVQTLMKAGVRPTPGQIIGGAAQRLEQGLTSVPLVGDAIKSGQRRAVNDFNRAAINDTLKPIGEKLSDKTPVGREAIAEAGQKITDAYNKILPQTTFTADNKFVQDVTNLRTLAENLPKESADQFNRILKNEVVSKINANTRLASGETYQTMKSEIGRLAREYRTSSVAGERQLGNALQELQNVLRQTLTRTNPSQAATLAANDAAYAKLLRVENAAGRIGSAEGVFSPAALTAAARQLDSSMRKRAFARGGALMQDLAEAGKSVLGSKVPDSGTPFRALAGAGLLTGGAGFLNPVAGGAALTGMSAYTPMGQRAVANLLATRPGVLRFLGRGVSALAPAAGAAVAPYGATLAPNSIGLLNQ